MEIKFLGSSSFVIIGKKENILVNPSQEIIDRGKPSGRIVTVSEADKAPILKDGSQILLAGAGEYEVGGIEVKGYSNGNKGTVYVMTVDEVEVGYLGDLVEPLSDKKIEKIDRVDVLLAPVEGKNIGEGKMVYDWAKKWGANYLVPFGYEADPDVSAGTGGRLLKFLDAVDSESLEAVPSLKVAKDSLPEGLDIVVLSVTK